VTVARRTLAIKGNSSALVIDAHVEGIAAHHTKHLTVGKHGRVKGQVSASSVTVLGQFVGEIRSDGFVSLAKGANVEGNIICARVLIEEGARFLGKIER
jgi:cytoskeletal protein CcmA (bactofilin family)